MKPLPLLLLALPAAAHEAPTGWSYSTFCCSGRDCAEAPSGAVTITPDGFAIVLQPGEHPMVTQRTFKALVPFGDKSLLQSGDEFFHVCIVSGAVRCFYAPPMGY